MNRNLNRTLTASMLFAGLALSGCDTKAQKEVDETAEAIDSSYEAQADMTEAMAANTPGEAVAENKAEALREKGEEIESHLKDMAEELDDIPKK